MTNFLSVLTILLCILSFARPYGAAYAEELLGRRDERIVLAESKGLDTKGVSLNEHGEENKDKKEKKAWRRCNIKKSKFHRCN